MGRLVVLMAIVAACGGSVAPYACEDAGLSGSKIAIRECLDALVDGGR